MLPETSKLQSGIVSKLKELAGPGGPAMVAGVAVGAAIVGGLFAIGEGFEKAFNTIRRETGATDAQMKGLEKSFKNVFAGTPGATMSNVAETMSLLRQRTGLTGKALEDLTSKEIELAKITKSDVNANTQITSGLFEKFHLTGLQASAALDALYAASRVGGKGVQELASDMASTRGITASMGLSFNQSAAMIAQFEHNNINASSALMALNRGMTKIAKEDGPPTTKSIESLAKAAAGADAALDKARLSAGRSGDAIALHGQKAQAAADKGLASAQAALDRVNARLETQRQKAIAAHGFFTQTAADTLALSQAQQRVADAQAKTAVSAGGTSGISASASAQQRLADATAKAAEAHAKLAAAQHAGAATSVDINVQLKTLFDQIKGAASETDALNIAATTFGVRGGRELGLAIRSGALNFQAFAGQLSKTGGEIQRTTFATLTLGDKFTLLKNKALVALQPIAAAVLSFANRLFNDLPNAFAKVQRVMEPVVNFIRHNTTPVLAALAAVGTMVVIPMLAALALAIPPLIGLIASMAVAAAPFVAVAAIAFGIVYAYQHFKIFREVVGAVVHWFERLPETFSNVVGHVVSFFQQLPGRVGNALLSLGESLVSSFASAFVGLVQALPQLIGDLVAFMVELPFKLIALYIRADTWLIETGMKALSGLITGAVNFLPTLWGWLKKLPGLYIHGLIMEVKAEVWLVETGVKILTGLVTGAAAFLPTLLGWLGKLPGLMVSAVESLFGLFLKVGKAIIDGIIKGLKDGAGSLLSAAKDAITNPLKKLPIVGGLFGSPSPFYIEVGQAMMQGLAIGIANAAAMPQRAAALAFAGFQTQTPGLAGIGGTSFNVTGGGFGTSASKLDSINAHLANMNRHLEARQPLVVHQAIASTEPKKAASESTRLLAAAGYRAGR